MSNKNHEKMDGVFDNQTTVKPEVKTEKPARPPKSKTSFSRETKVGLAVIAALLVIFVVVLVIRLRDNADATTDPVAKSKASGAERAKQSETQAKKTAPANAPKVIPANSGLSGASQYFSGTTSDAKRGSGGGSIPGGSIYAPVERATDQRAPSGGYLPQDTAQNLSKTGAGEYDLQDPRNNSGTNPLRANQSVVQPNASGLAADRSVAPSAAVNPFKSAYQLDPPPADGATSGSATAGDVDDVDDVAATRSGPSLSKSKTGVDNDPFSKRPANISKNDASNSITDNLSEPLAGGGFDAQIGSRLQIAPTTKNGDNAFEPGNTVETKLGEAERFVPHTVRPVADANRLANNSQRKMANEREASEELTAADDKEIAPPFRPADGFESSAPRQAVANSADAAAASRASKAGEAFQFGAARQHEPARLPAEPVTQHGEIAAPIQGGELSNGEETYAVRASDTYWTIAQQKYGSGAYFKALYEHNRRRLRGTEALGPGMQLILPDEATLQRLYPTLCPRPQQLASAARATRASANLETDNRTYVVKEGDTLFEVARRQLGNAKRSGEIYQLNRDTIGPPSRRLEPGTQLVLPGGATNAK